MFRLAVQNGDGEIRTLDPLLARQVLSQLSYIPTSPSTPLSLAPRFAPSSQRSVMAPLPQKTSFFGDPLFFKKCSGAHLFSRVVSNKVPSAVQGLTVVFGMGTGVSPARIDTRTVKL